MQVLLTVAYDGTAYAGWQRQLNGMAVQQKLEEALAAVMARPVVVRAASRTDAGVHALGQRAAFMADGLKIPLDKLPAVLNGYLPRDIAVTAAEYAADDFNPRFGAKQKTYRYQWWNAPQPNPLLNRYSLFAPQPLDTGEMADCAAFFVGRHDFAAFYKAVPETEENGTVRIKSTVREVYACKITADGPLITLTVTGNGFLYNMVRILAGTVWYAGLGKLKPEDIPGIIASKDRTRAGKTLPPEGLTLIEVRY